MRYSIWLAASIDLSFNTSAIVRTGLWISGPSPLANSRPMPMGSSGSSMSAKMIAASISYRLTGWIVTSAATSGVLHISRKVRFVRISRYSGKYRPAWRIIHTGVQSTASRLHALMNLSALDIYGLLSGLVCPAADCAERHLKTLLRLITSV